MKLYWSHSHGFLLSEYITHKYKPVNDKKMNNLSAIM